MDSQTINRRRLTLILVLALIAGAILYLEFTKPRTAFLPAEEVAAPSNDQIRAQKSGRFELAKEITTPDGFINTEPFELGDLIGDRVILLDFWTYSCINCQRTTPYLNTWHDKYFDQGLTIIGVHTPEFAFEAEFDNVLAAVREFGIEFPVVLDNDYSTWHAYRNQYWPRKYLIDIDGYIVYDHIGEGGYEETEQKIQEALTERLARLGDLDGLQMPVGGVGEVVTPDFSQVNSPEIYFGASRNDRLANGTPGDTGTFTFIPSTSPSLNALYLGGDWAIESEFAETANAEATVQFRFDAKNVYMVASADQAVRVQVLIDGAPVDSLAGADVIDGFATISEDRLYHLIDNPSGYEEHTLELRVNGEGMKVYTFTFG